MNHDLRLPRQMTSENLDIIREVLAVEADLTAKCESVGIARVQVPGLLAATREDEHVALLSKGPAAWREEPTNLLETEDVGEGLIEYRFMPKSDEYRG